MGITAMFKPRQSFLFFRYFSERPFLAAAPAANIMLRFLLSRGGSGGDCQPGVAGWPGPGRSGRNKGCSGVGKYLRQRNLTVLRNHLLIPNGHITRRDRNSQNKHASGLLWFTGFSGAGKSTIAHGAELELFKRGIRSYVLDGDHIRSGLNRDLGFSRQDRRENLRRIAEIARLFVDAGIIVLACFISPYREDRTAIRTSFAGDNFYEIFIKCSIAECERRDPEGKYRMARQGLIKNYTGISAPYEEPQNSDLIIDTENSDIADSIQMVLKFMEQMELLEVDRPAGLKY